MALTAKIDEIKGVVNTQKKRVHDSIQNMLRDLSELGSANYPIAEKVCSPSTITIMKCSRVNP